MSSQPKLELIHMNVIDNPLSQSSTGKAVPGDTLERQIQFRFTLGLRSNVDWDASFYFVGQLSKVPIAGYTSLGMHPRRRIGESIAFSIPG